jgi:hypothetical protein
MGRLVAGQLEHLAGINHVWVGDVVVASNLLPRAVVALGDGAQGVTLLYRDAVAAMVVVVAGPAVGARPGPRAAVASAGVASGTASAVSAAVLVIPPASVVVLAATSVIVLSSASLLLLFPVLLLLLLVVVLLPVMNSVLELVAGKGTGQGTDYSARLAVADLVASKGTGGSAS